VQAKLYNFLGALLFTLKQNHKLCDTCWCSVLDTTGEPNKVRHFTELREFKENAHLCYPSQNLSFRYNWPQLLNNKMTKDMFTRHVLQEPSKVPNEIPSCHGVLQKLLKMFVNSLFFST
jgi:hypothetical protein